LRFEEVTRNMMTMLMTRYTMKKKQKTKKQNPHKDDHDVKTLITPW
jgi:hypothetical protein